MLSRSVVSDSATQWTAAQQATLSMGFSRQECWRALPFPPPEDLPDPGIEPSTPTSRALACGFFTTVIPGKRDLGSYGWKAQILYIRFTSSFGASGLKSNPRVNGLEWIYTRVKNIKTLEDFGQRKLIITGFLFYFPKKRLASFVLWTVTLRQLENASSVSVDTHTTAQSQS